MNDKIRDNNIRSKRPVVARRRRERGITLIEMLVVVTIIALFVGLVGVNIFGQADKAKVTAAKAQIQNFTNALGLYKLEVGQYPPTSMGLEALRQNLANSPRWAGPYMPQEVPLDPWGNPYLYKYPGDHGDMPDIISLGGDGEPGGEDTNADINSWQ